jgi:hypothetical protein
MPSISSKASLSRTSYGKSRIRLVQVLRRGDRHEVRDLTVAIAFEGDYDTSYTDGRQSRRAADRHDEKHRGMRWRRATARASPRPSARSSAHISSAAIRN